MEVNRKAKTIKSRQNSMLHHVFPDCCKTKLYPPVLTHIARISYISEGDPKSGNFFSAGRTSSKKNTNKKGSSVISDFTLTDFLCVKKIYNIATAFVVLLKGGYAVFGHICRTTVQTSGAFGVFPLTAVDCDLTAAQAGVGRRCAAVL